MIIHCSIVFIGIMSLLNLFRRGFESSTFYLWLLFIILNIFIVINLIEKSRKSILLINIFSIPILIRFLWIFASDTISSNIFSFYSFRILFFISVYLFLVNKYKMKYMATDEIEEIGQKEN